VVHYIGKHFFNLIERFGTEKRAESAKGGNPGPGQYHIPCSFMDVPRYLTVGGGFHEEYRYI